MSRPDDGGRGRQFRSRWTMLRLFSWRHGMFSHRFQGHVLFVRWSLNKLGRMPRLWGVYCYRNDDEELNIDVGFWPLQVETAWSEWLRPTDGNASSVEGG